ncbi:MAG: SDR family oxidoreductase [Burkholderiales bacterium]|jgi:nucleoside-diphosphate-sugar epimerase|nr:SDR family oxidoreductase [Burkholderiales bacterium]
MKRRLLIVGCGDVGRRALPLLASRYRVYALARSDASLEAVRAVGARPLKGDLDRPETLQRLDGIAHDVLHMAPPPGRGDRDTRTVHLLRALSAAGTVPQRFVYLSTTGVYGDRRGARVDETAAPQPESDRARRRIDAERTLRAWARGHGVALSILRVPGIYAADRLPTERLRAGTPALTPDVDGWSNHIHADDLARICAAALVRGRGGRVVNAVDDSEMKMGDWFDAVADHFGLPRPPRLPLDAARAAVSPALWSFMRESRRIANARLKRELRVRLAYPTATAGLQAMARTR